MATFNHTRGDSPRTPCAKCAPECGWLHDASSDALRCPDCKQLVSAEWLEQASCEGREHVCPSPKSADERAHAALVRGMVRRGLEVATDDQLRAECERRKLSVGDDTQCSLACERLTAERDEWKRRAEAAEERVASLEARIEGGYLPNIARLMRLNERGPGIAATKPDNERWGPSDEDRLCEDA